MKSIHPSRLPDSRWRESTPAPGLLGREDHSDRFPTLRITREQRILGVWTSLFSARRLASFLDGELERSGGCEVDLVASQALSSVALDPSFPGRPDVLILGYGAKDGLPSDALECVMEWLGEWLGISSRDGGMMVSLLRADPESQTPDPWWVERIRDCLDENSSDLIHWIDPRNCQPQIDDNCWMVEKRSV